MPNGLTDAEVIASRNEHGDNRLPDSPPTTFWQEFKQTFGDPMIRILLVIAALMIVMWAMGYAEIYEPAGTITAVLIVAAVSAKTGVASDTKYRELKERTRGEQCRALRADGPRMIDTDDVVVRDIIMLGAGDKIPADGLLISGAIRVNNASLNGEVEECPKNAAGDARFPEAIDGDTLTDGHTLFRGAVVTDGDGLMLVHRVGTSTMMGQMATEMQQGEPDSPLKVKLAKLASQITAFGYIGASLITLLYIAFFVANAGGPSAYIARGAQVVIGDVVRALSLGIVVIVCAVPEGLPLMISLVLMQNTSRMLERSVLVRTAIGIETAGSLNILFSDKTGTITKGMLEVTNVFAGDGSEMAAPSPLMRDVICRTTQAAFERGGRAIGGNATDRALLELVGEAAYLEAAADPSLAVEAHQPFNSSNKFSQAYIGPKHRTYYKGAPERLLASSRRCLCADGTTRELDAASVDALIDELASRAMRVIAFAYSEGPMTEDEINDDAVLIGLAAIRDDVRTEAREAIASVKRAGIQVVMMTGDRSETAAAIAREAGLLERDGDVVLTSAQLRELGDDDLKSMLPRIRVIARALPTDKSRMVRLCQEMGLVVGMTGDGVNDSPSLRRADVGFAMGSGTEAAKEAGEVIILDDNFRSIKDAIWYGRTIYHNILKFCRFQLAINVAAVAVSAIAPLLGVHEPLKVTHLLFVNLVMDSLGALMLGSEPALESYMTEPPRRRDENIVRAPMMHQILFVGAWMTAAGFAYLKLPLFASLFANEAQHLTGFFVYFILTALFNGFNVRSEGTAIFAGLDRNRSFVRVFLCIAAVQAMIVNAALVPPLAFVGEMFSCVPFPPAGWLAAAALAAAVIPADLARKRAARALRVR